MDVEKLVKTTGIHPVTFLSYVGSNGEYILSSEVHQFSYTHEYWFGGRKFLLGKLNNVLMIEVSTGASCVTTYDINGKISIEKIISAFKNKLSKVNLTIDELIFNYKKRQLNLDAWEINLVAF